jgi:hypothetical protein
MEVPGLFCLSIPKYWEYVWSVFSCRLQHLRVDTGIPYFPWLPQIVCTPSHTILYRERQTPGTGEFAQDAGKMRFDFVSAANNATIKSLVELPAGRFPDAERVGF